MTPSQTTSTPQPGDRLVAAIEAQTVAIADPPAADPGVANGRGPGPGGRDQAPGGAVHPARGARGDRLGRHPG